MSLKWIEDWSTGAEGEQATNRELQKLPDTWRIRHDLTWDGSFGNIDHVAIGPAGTFLIETKKLNGQRIHVSDGRVRIARTTHPDATWNGKSLVKQASREAFNLRDHIQATSRHNLKTAVTPVLLIWCDEMPPPTKVGAVWVIAGQQINDWLQNQSQTIPQREADMIWETLG